MNRNIVLCAALVILLSFKVYSQSLINDILLTAWNDESVKNKLNLLEYRKSHPQTLQWLDKVELRTQTNDFNLEQQEYGIRFYGTRPSDIGYRKQSEVLDIAALQTDAEDVLHKSLLNRYHLLLDLYLNDLEKNLLHQQDSFYKRKINYLESLLQNQLDDEVKNLILSTRKDDKLSARIQVLNKESEFIQQKLNDLGISAKPSSYTALWILPEQVRDIVRIDSSNLIHHPAIQRFNYASDKLNLEKAQNKAEKWDVLNFIQARWRNNPNDVLIKEKISIGAGFRIPYSGENRKNQNEFNFEAFKTDLAQKEWERNHILKSQTILADLSSVLTQIEQNQNRLFAFEKKFKNPDLLQHPALTVMDQLLIEETVLDWKEELYDLRKKLFRMYIDYLDHTRLISTTPYKNYLLRDLSVIKE